MLSEKKIKELVDYYLESAKSDLLDMEALYNNKRYSASLFFGHLVVEKVLKALLTKNTGKRALKIHNLRRLAEESGVEFNSKELDQFSEINTFNMEARYPDEKLEFYEKCTKSFTDPHHKFIKAIYKRYV